MEVHQLDCWEDLHVVRFTNITHSLTHSHSLIHSLCRLLSHSSLHSSTHLFIHSLIQSPTHPKWKSTCPLIFIHSYSSKCFMSPAWLASIVEGDSITNTALHCYLALLFSHPITPTFNIHSHFHSFTHTHCAHWFTLTHSLTYELPVTVTYTFLYF